MNILILSGSARTHNNTIRVAKAMQLFMKNSHQVKVIDFIQYDIPLLAQGGLQADSLSPFQQDLIHAIGEAHVILIVSPEYNWSTTPEILNMLHLLPNKPFQQLFNNKVFAFVGVSSGRGGKLPAIHLMQILNKLIGFGKFESIVSARIFESHFTKEVLDAEGRSLGNVEYDQGIQDFCLYTEMIANRWFGL